MCLDRVCVQLFAGETLEGGIEISGDSHVHAIGLAPQRTFVAEDGHVADTLDASGHREGEITGADAGRRRRDSIDA